MLIVILVLLLQPYEYISYNDIAIQALIPGVIAGAVLAGLVLLSIIATVISVVLILTYKKWSKGKFSN